MEYWPKNFGKIPLDVVFRPWLNQHRMYTWHLVNLVKHIFYFLTWNKYRNTKKILYPSLTNIFYAWNTYIQMYTNVHTHTIFRDFLKTIRSEKYRPHFIFKRSFRFGTAEHISFPAPRAPGSQRTRLREEGKRAMGDRRKEILKWVGYRDKFVTVGGLLAFYFAKEGSDNQPRG